MKLSFKGFDGIGAHLLSKAFVATLLLEGAFTRERQRYFAGEVQGSL